MKAVFYIPDSADWAGELGDIPWPLLPVANRPLLDHWLETCAEAGFNHVQVVLGEGVDSERYDADHDKPDGDPGGPAHGG